MTDARSLLPAPGRGQYDRRQPREARLLEQKARLMSATALALAADADATVAAVVKLAGVSRNTFYEYFDDLSHARVAAEQRAQQELEQALRTAEAQTRTPVERWRALAHAWLGWVSATPGSARLILRAAGAASSPAGKAIEAAFSRSLATLRASGVRGAELDSLRVTAVAAVSEAFGRRVADARLLAADAAPPASDQERVERALVDVAVRLLR